MKFSPVMGESSDHRKKADSRESRWESLEKEHTTKRLIFDGISKLSVAGMGLLGGESLPFALEGLGCLRCGEPGSRQPLPGETAHATQDIYVPFELCKQCDIPP